MTIFRNYCPILLLAFVALAAGHAHAAQTELKIATVSPEGSYWMKRMREGAEEIDQRTAGRVKLRFYGGGVMGNDKKVLRKMRVGQLHGATFTSGGLAEREPDQQVYGLPLLFANQQEVDYVRERMDAELQRRLDAAGLVSFGFAGAGFAKLMSNTPINDLDDLRGQKVWVPEGDTVTPAALKALGLAPVTLPITDVLTGLQTGLIDIIGSSAVAAVVLQWHTKVRYVSDLPITYIYATLAIDKGAFERIDAPDRAVVREVMEGIYAEFDRVNRLDEIEATKALLAAGIESVAIDQSVVPAWRDQVMTASRAHARNSDDLDAALLGQLEQHLADFRNTERAAENIP